MELIESKDQFNLIGIVECGSCKGTGLYKGMGEQGGARVVCYHCEGSGKVKVNLSWDKFFERKKDKDAKRIYTNGMGYVITDKDVDNSETGELMPFSQYGCSYEEWLKGGTPKPLEFLGCPYQETKQHLQTEDKNDLYKTRCKDNLKWGLIRECKCYRDKAACWKIFNGIK